MVGLVVALIAATCIFGCRYSATFWDTFLPQFMAVVFGVVFTAMFAWAVWRYQQRMQRSACRQQLIKDLKFEVNENIRRLEDTEAFFDESRHQDRDSITMRGLRTVATKHILQPENLGIVQDIQLEDDVAWMLMHIEKYNTVFADASSQFFNDLQAGTDARAFKSRMRSRVLEESSFRFLQGFLKSLSQRIAGLE